VQLSWAEHVKKSVTEYQTLTSKEVKMTPDERNRLRRSRRNRIFAGVCGGLADFFGINAFWFRLAFLIALLPGGLPGFLPYIILWIIIPSE
jgi:phage shock protein PspC (stress-responsive transcriptional regulator)